MKAGSKKFVKIYVRLLEEGVEVWRPVDAFETNQRGVFEIIGIDGGVPGSEKWEFQPQDRVYAVPKSFSESNDEEVLVAIKKAD